MKRERTSVWTREEKWDAAIGMLAAIDVALLWILINIWWAYFDLPVIYWD